MQTVILAAGEGTRMRPLTAKTPKPMLPVVDRPVLAHVADVAVDGGASELIFVVGYHAESIQSHFGESYRGVPVTYVEQPKQDGTADAVRAAESHLDGSFVVLNGDNLYDATSVQALFENGPALGTYEVSTPSNYGVVSVTDGSVTDIVEKPADPPTDLANAGAYAFPAKAREWLDVPRSERGEHEITDVVTKVIDAYDVSAVELDRWLDVGRPWELLEANETVLASIERDIRGTVSDDADLRGSVVIEAGATVEPGVVIDGPVYVRSGAEIGPNAYVRGASMIGADVHIGNAVEIKNSVVRADTNVAHLSYVGDSVLGKSVNFGAGTKVANLRHDGETIRATVNGDRVSTGRRKFGVVAGDDVKTGINTSIDPGVMLSTGIVTDPAERVSRDR
ncbi:bifunctional sugar-1-phosphate nucleotidylyltransferase/acetyltransferase [Halorhabdus sp. CUG00001]|uniref:bifunctional sugar-1-phosphate nucleotidylyltransferase/acetyltransferase n=1 Tax=Halorhabdus sp. CUG00001 TaxID=2600297 RepID=UPI00131D62B9|nr:bifunctional sugar-1-phosphate nucleotidylyltransferase/acetyltransferase [Halorhabdus sp. CUG00001]